MKNCWGSYSFAFLLLSICSIGFSDVGAVSGAAETKSKSTKSKAAKVNLRLPRYFASIVDSEQRAEIYEIQKSYHAKIAKLQAELAALESEQLEEIEGVLSKDQLTSLNKMRDGKTLTKKSSKSTSAKSSSSKKTTKRASDDEEDEDEDEEEEEDDDDDDDDSRED